jgi:hypothetical protein
MHDKHWGNKLSIPEFIQAVIGFFDNGSRVRRLLAARFLELLQPLRDMMADQNLYRFYARSEQRHANVYARAPSSSLTRPLAMALQSVYSISMYSPKCVGSSLRVLAHAPASKCHMACVSSTLMERVINDVWLLENHF